MNNIIKPWWVIIRIITSTANGQIFGLGSNNKVYVWHHSLEHRGKWVIHYMITEEEEELNKITI